MLATHTQIIRAPTQDEDAQVLATMYAEYITLFWSCTVGARNLCVVYMGT